VTDSTARCQKSSENELISRAIRGEEAAFAELFEAHKNHVYSLSLRMTGNVAEAEDLTQDAFIQVFRKLGTFRGDSALSTWIYRVAVNTALMHFRKKGLRQISLEQRQDQDVPKEKYEPCQDDGRLRGTVDRIALTRAIGELPQGYRTIFLLHDVEGYGHQEIARLLKCSVGNSKSQLHKARLRIRESLRATAQANAHVPVAEASPAADARAVRVVQASGPKSTSGKPPRRAYALPASPYLSEKEALV
jgi:RNA polymerase sigma-70 factor (ECF subfamily)